MKYYIKYYKPLTILGFALILLFSCSGGDDTEPYIPPVAEKIIPSNISLEITMVGADVNNPNGDGSGTINCIATATDAVKYEFRFDIGAEVESTTGIVSHTYTQKETNTYTVYVYAYSKTGDYISASKEITVFVASKLFFSDEFDIDGSPDDSKWTYDLGAGGWGNGEKQYYTKRSENVIVEGGMLKITAKKENYEGSAYTSTRMLTMGKFDFTYGKVEVRAKLPIGVGTWPAIWMLGSDFLSNTWPACGEIDIMEHVGYEQGKIHSSLHTTSSSGATDNTGGTYLSDVSTAFHVYGVEWTSEEIIFTVDGIEHYTYPSNNNSSTWPFDSDQFIILNIAMGGSWGGIKGIDPNFTQSSMEIDYVRVYQ